MLQHQRNARVSHRVMTDAGQTEGLERPNNAVARRLLRRRRVIRLFPEYVPAPLVIALRQ